MDKKIVYLVDQGDCAVDPSIAARRECPDVYQVLGVVIDGTYLFELPGREFVRIAGYGGHQPAHASENINRRIVPAVCKFP